MECRKRLEDMTLQELWELFPIVLTPHNAEWKKWADDEIEILNKLLGRFTPIINHIGSTAIPGIQAKPIADILVEVPSDSDYDEIRNLLVDSGYICMSQSRDRLSFNRGYTPEGYADKVFHIHIHRVGDNDEILFRDYLISHPEKAKEYENLKLSLLPKYKNNRDAYTEEKSDFVKRIIEYAKLKFTQVFDNKKLHIDLLLLGDEQEDMIDRYLERGDLWTLKNDNDEVKAICVVTDEGDGILEIKNIAVRTDSQRKGYGKIMIEFLIKQYGNFTKMRVGTGESPMTLPFYHSCGFKETDRIRNFFTDNYNHPIIEHGVLLRDMIILERGITHRNKSIPVTLMEFRL